MQYQQDHLKYRRSLSNLNVVTRTSEKTRGDVTGFLGLSHVKGNFHAWFLEGKGLATTPTYSTDEPFDETKPSKIAEPLKPDLSIEESVDIKKHK